MVRLNILRKIFFTDTLLYPYNMWLKDTLNCFAQFKEKWFELKTPSIARHQILRLHKLLGQTLCSKCNALQKVLFEDELSKASHVSPTVVGGDYFDFFGNKPTFYNRPDGFECGLIYQTII